VVLLILAVMWLAVLLPPALRRRYESRPGASIGAFQRQLMVISQTTPGGQRVVETEHRIAAPGAPMTLREARQRRRDILVGLAVAAGASLLLAIAIGGPLPVGFNLVADTLLVGYIALLARAQRVSAARGATVTVLPTPAVVGVEHAEVAYARTGTLY